MSANLRARLLVACELKEKETRSREGNASPAAQGLQQGIAIIQEAPISDRPLAYLALLKKRVKDAMGQVPQSEQGVMQGLEIVLAQIEEEAIKHDVDSKSLGSLPIRVSADNSEDIRLWSERLGCSEGQLMDAIAQVGTLVEHIKNYLRRSTTKRTS